MSVATPIVGAAPSPRLVLGPHGLAQRVPCRICGATVGQPCTADDVARDDPHHSRWIGYQKTMRTRPFLAVIVHDIDADLRAGDVVTCASAENGRDVRILGDTLGRPRRAEPVSAGDVEFRAFVGESGERRSPRPGAVRRAHARPA
ncbi:zinc finger domain-containing protein [Agilicoccus flavus]|uniref:zinc finger domain-containing protein n=1 Tax=Agilicoccus flavus TaxID=2775968 RepID=UPI001CF6B3B9|nr:hypothetical protein [Agilicoccus flavus]